MEDFLNTILSYRKQLEMKLDPFRYEHSLSVSFTCVSLAMRYGIDTEKAELAGLLHDCGKKFSDEMILRKCEKHHIPITSEERKAPAVLHANYGAWLAEHKYGITDPEILSAILFHTTGKENMSMLEKIVYIADYIEPRRYKAADLPVIRRLAYTDLDETMYEILNGTLSYLNKKGSSIDPMTVEAHQYYEKLHNAHNTKEQIDYDAV